MSKAKTSSHIPYTSENPLSDSDVNQENNSDFLQPDFDPSTTLNNFIPLNKRAFFEHFDRTKLLKIVGHPIVKEHRDPAVLATLIKYLHATESNSTKKVTYKRSENGIGRLIGNGSMQSFPRFVRHTICHEMYWDLDIVNCHPVLLLQLCKKQRLSTPCLESYVRDRDTVLKDTMSTYNVSKDQAKNLFIRILYGGTFKGWAHDNAVFGDESGYTQQFQEEMSQIQNHYWLRHPKLQKLVETKPHPKGSLLAIVLNIEEDKILSEIVRFEEQHHGRVIDVLMFDGCQIRREADRIITDAELQECSDWIFHETGYRVDLMLKPMDELVDLSEAKPQYHLVCKTEHDAAIALKELHGADLFKFCNGQLCVYDHRTGMWNNSPITIHQQMLELYSEELGDWVETVIKWKKVYQMLETSSIDPMFLKRMQLTSLGKILFKNGYYDFETKQFSTEFDPAIFFPFRIERDYNADRNQEHMHSVDKILFVLPFHCKSVGQFVKESLARALAGCIRDKRLYMTIGPPNAGKGVLTDALLACCEGYAGTFNGGVLQHQGDKDSALRNKEYFERRYCRILMSNEVPMHKSLDGVFLKTISSGGDQMTGRQLYCNGGDFIPHGTTFINCNDRPKIVPSDDALTFRMPSVEYCKTFSLDSSKVDGQRVLLADPKLKDIINQSWFSEALFHLLTDAYTPEKSAIPATVQSFTSSWNAEDDFLANLLQYYEVTGNHAEDQISNKELVQWASDNNFKISSIQIGLEILKVNGVKKKATNHGVQYCGIRRIPLGFQADF